MKGKFIVKVAPLIRLPIARTQVFSYFFPEPIAAGSLVEAPFYNRVIPGIVIESRSDFPRKGNFEIKPVKKITEEKLLSEKQIELAKEIAGFYLSPLGTVLKFMVPKIAKAGKRKKTNSTKPQIIKNNNRAKEMISAKDKEFALIGPKDERDQIIFSAMKQALEEKKQFLHLSSEIFPAAAFFEKLKYFFPAEEIALAHGSVSRGEFYEYWEKIKKGKAKIIIASKMGVFLPFCELGGIAVEESGDISHKQWNMNPRYNAVQVARMLAGIHGAKIILSNSSPSVEIWERAKKNKVKIINLWKKEAMPRIKITNIFEERKSADFPIGKELYKSLASAINKKKKALLVVNRKGFSSYSICRGCKAILRCPDCDRALVYFEEKEKYKCLHCSHKSDLLSACPSCGACQFSHQGVGIQLVEKKIRRLFRAARILRLDADVSKSQKRNDDILKKLAKGDFDILVGTQIALKIGGLRKFDLVAFPDFDNLGSIPDFNTRETVFTMLCQAESLTVKNNGALLVQTSLWDDSLLTFFQNQNMADFFEKELKERKKTANPPFSRLVKIIYRDKDRKKVDAETKKTFGLLEALSNSSIDISEPYEPFAAKRRGYYYKNILIKAGPEADVRKLPIFPILGGLRKGWTADVDPISTI